MDNTIDDLCKFLHIGARLDLKSVALEHILGLTGTEDGVKTSLAHPKILISCMCLLDDNSKPLSKDAALSLINVSASEKGCEALLNLDVGSFRVPLQNTPEDVVRTVLKFILDPESHLADPCCMILSNLTRPACCVDRVIDSIETSVGFEKLINAFTKTGYNKTGANLHYLGPVLSNLSQNARVRRYVLNQSNAVVQRLLPFTEFPDSLVRRGGVVGTLKNCCFESDFHEWLLSEDVDILPRLLLPLAGNDEYDDEDNDRLPLELQYLPADKQRERDPDIKCILIEALTQLCAKRINRQYVRDKNAYVILRDLHKVEEDEQVRTACENLVNVLVRTEDEIGENDLGRLEIPDRLLETFNKVT